MVIGSKVTSEWMKVKLTNLNTVNEIIIAKFKVLLIAILKSNYVYNIYMRIMYLMKFLRQCNLLNLLKNIEGTL